MRCVQCVECEWGGEDRGRRESGVGHVLPGKGNWAFLLGTGKRKVLALSGFCDLTLLQGSSPGTLGKTKEWRCSSWEVEDEGLGWWNESGGEREALSAVGGSIQESGEKAAPEDCEVSGWGP